MNQEGKIRVLALGLIRRGDRLFLSRGYDPVKQQTFYRALGGGVDFGEASDVALKREFREELNTEVINLRYLGCLENLFTFNGKAGHEIIQLYECDFADPKFYELNEVTFKEGDREKLALWVNIDQCRSGELRVVPDNFLEYL
jgi:8-oxo-dGTP pyrophosphatase MutT (NUDIX family)